MINKETIKKIEDFVYLKPRSIQEIAEHINKNWRTADRYIEEIAKEYGTISLRVFRKGTRGALKIAYWSSVDKISNSIFQEQIEQRIFNEKRKEDFSAFDIFQYVDSKHKKVFVERASNEELTDLKSLVEIFESAQKQIIFFSGNLSFINLKNKEFDIFNTINKVVKKGISIKIICRVDLVGRNNIEKMLSLNNIYGKELIEIHHREQPLRAIIIDKKVIRIKEIKEPTNKIHELNKKIFLFYEINDKEWIDWMLKVFWKIFSQSIDSNVRIKEFENIKI